MLGRPLSEQASLFGSIRAWLLAAEFSGTASFSVASSAAALPDTGTTFGERLEDALAARCARVHPLLAADVVRTIGFGVRRANTAKKDADSESSDCHFRKGHDFLAIYLFLQPRAES